MNTEPRRRWYGPRISLELRPITFEAACAFIAEHHRHNKPPVGHKFSVAVHEDMTLVGVAMTGRPIARMLDDGLTLEILRVCAFGAPNVNSMLYGACRRAAWAIGYRKVVTYTQELDGVGASLRASGFIKVKELEARESWADSANAPWINRDPIGNGGVARIRWEISRKPAYEPALKDLV